MTPKLLSLAVLGALAVPFAAQADEVEDVPSAYLGLGANYLNFDDNRGVDEATAPFAIFGVHFNENWATEVFWSEFDAEVTGSSLELDTRHYGLDVLYSFSDETRSGAYFKGGFSKYKLDGGPDDNAFKTGLGYEWTPSDHFFIRTELGMLWGEEDGDNDGYAGITFGWYFNAPKTVRAPEPQPVKRELPPSPEAKDSDGDGVVDVRDACKNTPKGVRVDAKGCALDDDRDGVPNHKDECANTPAGAKVDEKGCRIILEKAVSIRMDVKFPTNSSKVPESYQSEIRKVADFMREYPDTQATIAGHTDNTGDASYNQWLSQRRAESVMEQLIRRYNVDPSRLTAKGFGEERPETSNDTAEGRAQNRRVVAILATKVKEPQ